VDLTGMVVTADAWRQIRVGHTEDHHGHGRTERRSLKVVTIAEGLLFPHAAQAIAIIRKTRPRHGGKWSTITVYAVTSLAAHQARPDELTTWIRHHWQIEALHHIRDVTYREEASQIVDCRTRVWLVLSRRALANRSRSSIPTRPVLRWVHHV
jgi:hypothetical protein